MVQRFNIVIIGAGPAGLSAAGRAAQYDVETQQAEPTHLLLEGFSTFSKTIYRYQKGKHVMAEPGFLALRSPMEFVASKREQVLQTWEDGIDREKINIRYNAEVSGIKGEKGNFTITLQSGELIEAENVVLAIGLQGNPRRLGVGGDDESDFVRYTLDDPAEFNDETIIVVGAGDAAIENATALSAKNTIHIINRRDEFSRAKDGNLNDVLAAINDKQRSFYCSYNSSVAAVTLPQAEGEMGALVLNTPEGEKTIECHRIIARLGAIPPRGFVEKCGIEIASDKQDAIPDLDRQYQSNVPGLYIIGALGGYPLIKQAMNQGYDVVEFIRGNSIKPADYPILQQQFSQLPYFMDAEDVLDLYQQRVPMFRRMNALSFRELIIESTITSTVLEEDYDQATAELLKITAGRKPRLLRAGETIYSDGEYSNTFYTIVEGDVKLQLEAGGDWHTISAGQFFGEMSLLSGRPRQGDAVAGNDCILIETSRRIMVKLMNSNEEVRQGIDKVFMMRALQRSFHPKMSIAQLGDVAAKVELCIFNANDTLYEAGETGDSLFLIRSGSVSLLSVDSQAVVALRVSGDLVGQLALMGDPIRKETAVAAVRSECIRIAKTEFLALVASQPDHIDTLQLDLSRDLKLSNAMASRPENGNVVSFLMDQGLGEATNALLIDESLCVGCDNCETACAETHAGVSRLQRSAGKSYASIHVPVSCRHCEQPHCMKDCPTDAIRRAKGGEVFIETDSCIGCGNCETNCPYDVIKLSYPAPEKPGFWSWLLFGNELGEDKNSEPSAEAKDKGKKAVKCDACVDLSGGPACVRACPTGAAARTSPQQFFELVAKK